MPSPNPIPPHRAGCDTRSVFFSAENSWFEIKFFPKKSEYDEREKCL